ncbi:DUF6728 family protein [Bernardetia sp. ABR2-2B]|uniref:DUF6728 family protein n=1 Tax=Bernardetia sp. ABR2-2B TaxID=3127472 RepID=UPI0030D36618
MQTTKANIEDNNNSEKIVRKKKNSLKDYFALMPVLTYFFTKKNSKNFNIRAMHTINKISITVFLLGIIFIIVKKLFLS